MACAPEKGIAYSIKVPGNQNSSTSSGNSESSEIGILRSGGLYCTKCEVTLLRDGEEAARNAGKVHCNACPLCDMKQEEGIANGQFANCNCFEWKIGPHRLRQKNFSSLVIQDSFGDTYSVERFFSRVVDQNKCPIQFYDKIEH